MTPHSPTAECCLHRQAVCTKRAISLSIYILVRVSLTRFRRRLSTKPSNNLDGIIHACAAQDHARFRMSFADADLQAGILGQCSVWSCPQGGTSTVEVEVRACPSLHCL